MTEIRRSERVMINISVTNVVATGNLGQEVDLERVATLRYVLFDLDIYHCAYVKTPRMYSKVSVFDTGKMISVGTRSEEQARRDLVRTAEYLARKGIVKRADPGMTVQNIVLTGSFGHPIDIAHLHTTIGSSIYEPEQFPGVIHHPPEHPGISILFFQSGKFVVAGIRSFQNIKKIEHDLSAIGSRFESAAVPT